MLKSILGLVMSLGFVATANAAYEIQINGSFLGTAGGIEMSDDGTDDATDYGLGAEVYFGMSENLQVGGLFAYMDGDSFTDAQIQLGALVRYNLDAELRNSIFINGGLGYTDFGPGDSIGLLVGAGKRFAISETLTWTPNISVTLNVGGDLDEGHTIALNLLSFSGFMD